MHKMTRHMAGFSWLLLTHLPLGSNRWAASQAWDANFQNPIQGITLNKELYFWRSLHGFWLLKWEISWNPGGLLYLPGDYPGPAHHPLLS